MGTFVQVGSDLIELPCGDSSEVDVAGQVLPELPVRDFLTLLQRQMCTRHQHPAARGPSKGTQ